MVSEDLIKRLDTIIHSTKTPTLMLFPTLIILSCVNLMVTQFVRRHAGLVVERRTPEREAGGSIFTQVAVLCP